MSIRGSDLGVTVSPQGIYETSATQKLRLGTRLVRGDCVYRYSKAITAVTRMDHLMWNTYHQCINYAAIKTASPIGDNQIHVTSGSGDGINDDGEFLAHCLEGGHLVIFDNGTSVCYNFGILDNAAAVSAGDLVITLDGELVAATVATTDIVEGMGSPYLVSSGNSGGFRGFQGAPMVLNTTATPYMWLKTWGPHWISPETNVGASHDVNQLVVRHDGSLDVHANSLMKDADADYAANAQMVGYVMTHAQGGTQGAPIIMLQINP